MKHTIWYISKYVTPPGYGVGTRAFHLAREFARMGHRAVIITSDSNHGGRFPDFPRRYTREEIEDVVVCWIRTLKYRRTASVRRVLSWLDFELKLLLMPDDVVERPSVVIASSLSLLTILNGYRLKRKHGCVLVFEVRDIWPLTMVEEGGFSPWHPFVRLLAWVEKYGYEKADVIVGTMPNLSEHVSAILGEPRECHCIPMGYERGATEPGARLPEAYVAEHIPKNKFVVCHAGSIGMANALDTFIECSALMVDDRDVHFLFVGEGDMRAHYEAKVREQGNVTFAPSVPKDQVVALLEACDLLYFSVHDSAVWRYGQSLNKLVDYMMAGRPIVASYGGYPSMVNEAECGSLLPPRDTAALTAEIRRYAHMSAAERNAIGARGRQWVLTHRSYDVLARDYAELFMSVANSRDATLP